MGGDPTLGSGESGNGFAGLAELLIPITTTLEVERAQIQEYLLRNIPGPGNNWKSEVDPNDPEVHQRFERGVWLSNVLTYLKTHLPVSNRNGYSDRTECEGGSKVYSYECYSY